eukprot:6444861-Heterocapsa_arctica.AAC.1
MIKEDVKYENNELRDCVDDMVLFKEGDTEEEAISGLYKDLMEAKKVDRHRTGIERQERADSCLKQDRRRSLAPNLPRLQRQSRTSSH